MTDHYVKAGSAALDRIPSVSDPAQPEEDFGMGEGWDDIPGASGPVDWAALAGKLTGDCAKFAEWAYEKHTGGAGPCSPKQYQFLTSLVDGLTGKQHTKVLSVLCRRDVSSENPPSGDMVKPLLDWLSPKSDKFSQAYADCIKNIGAI